MGRKSKGRRKIDMVKIKNESNLQVTFSKRRTGLFKKANELCVLCGAEVALMVFSPGERVYSFGHPSVGSVIDRFLQNNQSTLFNAADHVTEACRHAKLLRLNEELSNLEKLLADEKKRGEALDKSREDDQDQSKMQWWKAPIDELNPPQLLQFQKALESLEKDVDSELRSRPPTQDEASTSRYNFERGYFGTDVGPSNAIVPYVAGASEASGELSLRPFGPENIDLNRRASGSGSLEDMLDDCEPTHVHKFF